MGSVGKFRFAIDRGGTFTDVYAICPGNKIKVMKLLSEEPAKYKDASWEGIRRILQKELGASLSDKTPLDPKQIEWVRMGTTIATNALLERKGERMALVVTKGFRDLLKIGNQARPKIFDLKLESPTMLFEDVIEVDARNYPARSDCQLNSVNFNSENMLKVGIDNHQQYIIEKDIDTNAVKIDLEGILQKGIKSLAVALLHSYNCPDDELAIKNLALKMGFQHVSLSSEIMPMVRIVPRAFTACTDAYLTPLIKQYVKSFEGGFQKQESEEKMQVLFMQSDGGLTSANKFSGYMALLSGPAGGCVGYARTTDNEESKKAIIGFDMGGTSTDVSRFGNDFEHVFETKISGVSIQAPQLDIKTVAAGGGSILCFRSGLFAVGPESAGAHPGPACYKKGGPLCVTDANLVLGRLRPEYFPKIFGPKNDEPLDKSVSVTKFKEITAEINTFLKSKNQKMSLEEVALGFIQTANESMCRPIRTLTESQGYDPAHHVLACFGGAGGQHACAIARNLNINSIFIHKYAGILSAVGMALADVVHEEQRPCGVEFNSNHNIKIFQSLEELKNKCELELQKQGFSKDSMVFHLFLNMRYDRTDHSIMIECPPNSNYKKEFEKRHQMHFGFIKTDNSIWVDDVRVRGVGKTQSISRESSQKVGSDLPTSVSMENVYFENKMHETPVFLMDDMIAAQTISGPAIIILNNSTVLVEPNCTAEITISGDIKICVGVETTKTVSTELDIVQLTIFSHRFMSIAEQMGKILQLTAKSVNIKERLDFSCALFAHDGSLVANAPHIPVHLGAMQEAVQYQTRNYANNIRKGVTILTNHPNAGGSHLPDLTVVTPVFHADSTAPVFFVASRGHHTDIGGITPGSMPPHSTSLSQEGAVFKSFILVDETFKEHEVIEALNAPSMVEGCMGSRNLQDNLDDLKAQVAANKRGIELVHELCKEYGLHVVQAYMHHIQTNAELAVKDVLRDAARRAKDKNGKCQLSAEDYMDDGSKIKLMVDLDEKDGTGKFDFSGTGCEVYGNCNAPRAITMSALIYCLRCMVGYDMPLNQGCLKPADIYVPKGMLNPSENAAVVGGNVLTSQRVVDVILKAFGTCAASQGCMNNVTFGARTDSVSYYETVAGGSGAGPDWDGKSGLHTHMTNTRITDPEILENRYAVLLRTFEINEGTGGEGLHPGGNGLVREILFRKPMTLSVLSERRVFQPYGLEGGKCGKSGRNFLTYHKDMRTINLGGKNSIIVNTGDIFRLETPGGGGFGMLNDSTQVNGDNEPKTTRRHSGRLSTSSESPPKLARKECFVSGMFCPKNI